MKIQAKAAQATMTTLGAAVALLTLGTSAFAVDGTRGGGEFIDMPGYVVLRDLLAQSTCDWRTGDELINGNTELRSVLDKIAAVDWYFSASIEREMRAIDWCFTGPLTKVDTSDNDAILSSVAQDTKQVAIRVLDARDVYVDDELFHSANDRTQAFTILHETMHSFLNTQTSLRNLKLRSAVKTLSRVVGGAVTTRSELMRELAKDDVEFPFQTALLDPYRTLVEYVLGSDAEKSQILAKTDDVEALFAQTAGLPAVRDAFDPLDKDTFKGLSKEALVDDLCAAGMSPGVQALLRKPDLAFESIAACMGGAGDDTALRQLIVHYSGFSRAIDELYVDLGGAELSVAADRLMVGSALQALSHDRYTADPAIVLTSITPLKKGQHHFNAKGEMFYGYVKSLIDNGAWDVLASEVSANDRFYEAFSLSGLLEQLDSGAVKAPVAREAALAREVLVELPNAFWPAFLDRLSRELGPDRLADYNQFTSKIDFKRLGVNQN